MTKTVDYKKYYFIYDYFSSGQKYKINLLLFLLLVYPFIKVFGDYYYVISAEYRWSFLEDPLFLWTILNFVCVVGCLIAFVIHQKEYSLTIILSEVVIITLLISNLLFAEMAQVKWAINWLGFLFILGVVAQLLKSLSDAEMYVFQIRFIKVLAVLVFILTVLTFYALIIEPWYTDPAFLKYYILEERNQILSLYRYHIGGNKQSFGLFSMIVMSFVYTHWSVLSNKVKSVFITFFVINFVAIVGVRTVILSFMVGLLAFYFLKNKFRHLLAVLLASFILLIVYIYWNEIVDVIIILYDRFPALNFAVNAMTENVFGLGNGAYSVYVLENNDRLLSQFGSEKMEGHGVFWSAPESDLVYFIASWGVLSIVFFLALGFLVYKSVKLFKYKETLFPVEKFILLFSVFLIFMGISEDNTGGLTWWIFISSVFGIILRRRFLKNEPVAFHFDQMKYIKQKNE